jgi:hypothetical protein
MSILKVKYKENLILSRIIFIKALMLEIGLKEDKITMIN